MKESFPSDAKRIFQMFVGAMGKPGGGANMITSRFLRHMQIIGLDAFDDATMSKIFVSICDWHFSKNYDEKISRLSKVNIVKWFLNYSP